MTPPWKVERFRGRTHQHLFSAQNKTKSNRMKPFTRDINSMRVSRTLLLLISLLLLLPLSPPAAQAQSVTCPAGTQPNNGTCVTCTAGNIKPLAGNYTCQVCPFNSACADTISFSCKAGYEPANSTTTAGAIVFICNACASGFEKSSDGNTACSAAAKFSIGNILNWLIDNAKENVVLAIAIGFFTIVLILVGAWFGWKKLKSTCSELGPEREVDEEAQNLGAKAGGSSGSGGGGERDILASADDRRRSSAMDRPPPPRRQSDMDGRDRRRSAQDRQPTGDRRRDSRR